MALFTESELALVRAGDATLLATLDARGLFPAPGEDAAGFASRLEMLDRNLTGVEDTLREQGRYELSGLVLKPEDRIDPVLFTEAGELTDSLFAFRVDWVPGFYTDPHHAWLFGGCAFFDPDDFLTLFIIRKSFAKSPRWFLYDRRELLAHELTHVARNALRAERFEERFAYQTAKTAFRRSLGSVFRSQSDSFILLASVLLLVCAQFTQVLFLAWIPVWLFWLGVGGTVGRLAFRHWQTGAEFAAARYRLRPAFGAHALAVLCRCTDAEVRELADLPPAPAAAWLEARKASGELRWQVIFARFTTEAGDQPHS